ncbi:MAG: hypothetical protein GEV11_25515, partial [Streptosporangiales bacterium]|nr:hypothetical protein [Streptosporangiales bacterium]
MKSPPRTVKSHIRDGVLNYPDHWGDVERIWSYDALLAFTAGLPAGLLCALGVGLAVARQAPRLQPGVIGAALSAGYLVGLTHLTVTWLTASSGPLGTPRLAGLSPVEVAGALFDRYPIVWTGIALTFLGFLAAAGLGPWLYHGARVRRRLDLVVAGLVLLLLLSFLLPAAGGRPDLVAGGPVLLVLLITQATLTVLIVQPPVLLGVLATAIFTGAYIVPGSRRRPATMIALVLIPTITAGIHTFYLAPRGLPRPAVDRPV